MAIAKRVINTSKVKVTFYHNLEGWITSPGISASKRGAFKMLQSELLILEFHGFGYAIELVIE